MYPFATEALSPVAGKMLQKFLGLAWAAVVFG